MVKKEKAKNMIHLAIKAGKVKFGEDNYFFISKKDKVKLLIFDDSLSARAKEKILKIARLNKIKHIKYPGELDTDIKKGVKLISITDINFARTIHELLQ